MGGNMNRNSILGALALTTILSFGAAAAEDDASYRVEFSGAANGSFTESTQAENPPEAEFRRYANEGTNREGPYKLSFFGRLAPLDLFDGVAGAGSVHLKIERQLEPGRYEISADDEDDTLVSASVYTQDLDREIDEKKLWFIVGGDGSLEVDSMNMEQISGSYQVTLNNRTGEDSVTVNARFENIPYDIVPDIKVKLGGAFKQPEPPPFMEAETSTEGDTLSLTLKQQWGFTLQFDVPAGAVGKTIEIGPGKAGSGQLEARGYDPFPLTGSLTLDREGDYLKGEFELDGSIKGKAGSLEGWFDFVPVD